MQKEPIGIKIKSAGSSRISPLRSRRRPRKERSRNRRDRNASCQRKPTRKITRHLRSRIPTRCCSDSLSRDRNSSMGSTSNKACSIPPRVLALVVLVTAGVGPHGEILDRDPIAGLTVGTADYYGGSKSPVCAGAFPAGECEVGVQNSVSCCECFLRPIGVDV